MTNDDRLVQRSRHSVLVTPGIATPASPEGGTFTILSNVHIAQSAKSCFETTLRPSTYHAWNTFVPYISIDNRPPNSTSAMPALADVATNDFLQLGTGFTATVYMAAQSAFTEHPSRPTAKLPGSRSQKCLVSVLEEIKTEAGIRQGFRIAWRGVSIPQWLLRSERVQEFIDDGRGGCHYRGWETFAGPIAWIVKWYVGKQLVDRFEDCCLGLKMFMESHD